MPCRADISIIPITITIGYSSYSFDVPTNQNLEMITTYAFRWTNFVAVLHSSLLLLTCTEAGFGVYHDFDGIHRTNVWKSKRTNGRLRESYLDDNISKEEYLRNLAADALLKTTPFMNYEATENAKFRTAEQISKKYLRLLDNDIDRKRLSTLILGTTVMMRKYMYLLESYEKEHSGETVLSFDDKRTVRRLIDLHINDDATHKNEMKRVHWPSDPICRLSYEYSLPKFLCDILVTQYGINETLEIAKTSNVPGPITLRRNSLKIDDDDNFIQTLADLDGMVCSKLDGLMGCFQLDIDHSKTSIWGSEVKLIFSIMKIIYRPLNLTSIFILFSPGNKDCCKFNCLLLF